MENCLVTKLKSVVENDNLGTLGRLIIGRNYNSSDTAESAYFGVSRSSIADGQKVTLTIVGDGYFSTSFDGESIGKVVEVTKNAEGESTTLSLYTSNGNYKILVDNKYYFNIPYFPISYSINMADIYYTKIPQVSGDGYYGNVSELPLRIYSLKILDSQYGKVNYTEADIARLVNLKSFSIASERLPRISTATIGKLTLLEGDNQISSIQGSIENFVANQRAGGRTTFSGNLNLKWIGSLGTVTFNGAVIQNVQNGIITWTYDTITFRGTTINA